MAKDPSGWKEIQARFTRAAEEHPHLCAHWDHREDQWRLVDVIPDPRLTSIGGTVVFGPPVANAPAAELFKEMARTAVKLLGEPTNGAPAWHVWLDTMKKRKRGFHQRREIKSWADTRRVLEEGAHLPPSAFRVHEDGSISAIFKESADFCADLGIDSPDGGDGLREMLDRHLSEDHKRSLERLEEVLKANLQAHEQMRLIADPEAGGWQRVGSAQNLHSMADEVRKLERDLIVFSTGTMRVVAEALRPISSAQLLSSRLETYAHDLVEWLLERVNEQDLSFLNCQAIQDAVNAEVASHIKKARKEAPPPWRPATARTSGVAPSDRYGPRSMYHVTKEPVTVYSAEEEAALGPEWSRVYIHKEYPKCKYHWSGKDITVKNADEEAALGGGWANNPAAFGPYKGPRMAGSQHHPERWVDEWPISGLSPEARKKIKAQLWRADSEFWKAPDAPSADTAAMRLAFDGVANVLFSAGILTEDLLRDQIPLFVWDSAIAAGWWRLASETPQDMFREQLGHYWVWREEGKDWQGLFRSETGQWRAQLLEHSPTPAESSINRGAANADAVMDSFQNLAGMKSTDGNDRGFWLTVEIFPSLASVVPEKLGWAVEEIVGQHEGSIREAVIEALSGLRSSTQDQSPSALIFEAVAEMGAELFSEALGRMDWMDDSNPPEAYDDTADALYKDAIDFVIRKYKLLASEIPGVLPACEPVWLDALKVDWLQTREEAKQSIHEWSRKYRESQGFGTDAVARSRTGSDHCAPDYDASNTEGGDTGAAPSSEADPAKKPPAQRAPATNSPAARQRAPLTAESSASATNGAESSPDFTSEMKRNSAVAAYTAAWADCSDAALARTAKVNPSDLIKWKKGSLPSGSEKTARIERALRNNHAPTLLAKRSVDG